jgi:tRNA(Ile)-lysidine synthase
MSRPKANPGGRHPSIPGQQERFMRPGLPAEGPAWLGEVGRDLRRWRGEAVVAAVSGGADSVGLLRALVALAPGLELRLSVAHLDHGARGEASASDARFVAELASTLGLPFDLGRWRPGRSGHFESDARRARYAWLAEVAHARGASAVAVGHHRDDQAETILHRVLRGTGPRGLSGMPARRPLAEGVTLVRPLLSVGRDEIRAYLESLGQPWREDATNADTARTRARLRHDLLPKLAAEYNPRVAEALVRLGRLAGAEHRAWERTIARRIGSGMRREPDGRITLAIGRLRAQPLPHRAEACRLLWRAAGWPERAMDAGRWLRLARLIGTRRGRLVLGAGFEAVVEGDRLTLGPAASSPRDAADPVRLPIPGEARWAGIPLAATVGPDATCAELIDLDRLDPFGPPETPHLLVRAPRPGDRFEPLGMSGRTKPLNDFFRGIAISPDDRLRVPLVCDRRGIVWVAGHRIADRVRRTEATRRVLGLRCGLVGKGPSDSPGSHFERPSPGRFAATLSQGERGSDQPSLPQGGVTERGPNRPDLPVAVDRAGPRSYHPLPSSTRPPGDATTSGAPPRDGDDPPP